LFVVGWLVIVVCWGEYKTAVSSFFVVPVMARFVGDHEKI
jgi:hypothetical protein